VSNVPLSGSVRADDMGTMTRAKSQGLVEMSECIFYIYTGTFPLTLAFLTRVKFTRVKHPCHLLRHCLRDSLNAVIQPSRNVPELTSSPRSARLTSDLRPYAQNVPSERHVFV
jgi:hypothetical protein